MDIPDDIRCPVCGAPHHYIYDNNGGKGQYQCKVCGQTFCSSDLVTRPIRFICPHCGHCVSVDALLGLVPLEEEYSPSDFGTADYWEKRLEYLKNTRKIMWNEDYIRFLIRDV